MKSFVPALFFHLLLSSVFCIFDIPSAASEHRFEQMFIHEEGLGAGILISTTYGAKPIQELSEYDVLIDHKYQEQRITSITKIFVHRFVKLVLADQVIHAGCTQQFCAGSYDTWVAAKDLQTGDVLMSAAGHDTLIFDVQTIDENAMLYALTVDNHVFCIDPHDLIIHNAAAVLGSSSICLGSISIINPVTAAIGATVALSVIANQAWKSWRNQQHSNVVSPPEFVMIAERVYYESRKQDLERLKTELLRIKQDIETIKSLCNPSAYSFTYLLLNKVTGQQNNQLHAWLTITKDKELQLTKAQQQELRMLRQQKLLVLECEIIELQAALAIHSNELIGQVDAYCAEYRTASATVNSTFEQFRRGCLDTKAIAQFYACLITQDYMLDRLARKIQEACIIGDYYQRLSRRSGCIVSSTTITEKWKQVLPCVRLNTTWIDQDRRTCGQRIASVEESLRHCGGSITTLKNNLKKLAEKHVNSCDAHVLSTAINKLEVVTKEAKTTATLPVQEADKIKTVEDILVDAEIGEEKQVCKQFIKPGGYTEALKDFASLAPTEIKDISKNGQRGLTGILPNGRKVNVRERSTDKRPTLEVQPHENSSDKSIKIRYGTK